MTLRPLHLSRGLATLMRRHCPGLFVIERPANDNPWHPLGAA